MALTQARQRLQRSCAGVDSYSRFLVPFLTPLKLPAAFPPEKPSGRREALSPAQKNDLMAFLQRL